MKKSDALLIDRGDLSRYISIDKIPIIQEAIAKISNKKNRPLYVATNLLETMIKETNPTRAESHDIYSLGTNCLGSSKISILTTNTDYEAHVHDVSL